MTEIILNYCSKAMSRHVTVHVLLPFDSFHEGRCPAPPYKTLYFLNGYTASAQQVLSTVNLTVWAQQYGFAVVLPDGENSFYVDQPARNTLYGTYVSRELVEVTRKLFPLSDKREDTYLGGISMGGFGALMQGGHNVDTFSKIIALSPAAHPYDMVNQGCLPSAEIDAVFGGRERYMEEFDPLRLLVRAKKMGKAVPKIFLCCGTDDQLTYRVDCALRDNLAKADICVVYSEGPGAHNSFYWNKVLPEAMAFLAGD